MLKRRNPNSQVLKSAGDALLRSLREEKTSISKQAMMRSLRSYQPNNINDAASMRALRSYKPNIADKAMMRSLRSSDKKKNTEEKIKSVLKQETYSNWEGVVGEVPEKQQLTRALQEKVRLPLLHSYWSESVL